MIPKIIHIISNNEEEITLFKKRYEKYLKIHLMVWDNKTIIPLLEKYPQIYSVYKNVDKLSGFIHSISIQKLIASFVILKEYGGIYYGTDLNCFQFIKKIFSQKESNIISLMKSTPSSFLEKFTSYFFFQPNFNFHFLGIQKQHLIWEEVFQIIANSNCKYMIQNALSQVIKENHYPIYLYDCENGTYSFYQKKHSFPPFIFQIFLFLMVIIIIILVEKINRYNFNKFNLSTYIPGLTHPPPPPPPNVSLSKDTKKTFLKKKKK